MAEPTPTELQRKVVSLVRQLDEERQARIKAERSAHALRLILDRQRSELAQLKGGKGAEEIPH